ncbi:MAG: TolC family protein [Saprospiraceae bacterium]|nr:TolC family protein [Saprospiraceae bacterium]
MIMKYRLFLVLFCSLFANLNLTAQEAPVNLSMSDAVELALQNHLQIQIAEASMDIARNNNSWEAAGRYPTISLVVNGPNSYTDQSNPANVALPESTSLATGANGTLDATWVLFDGFKVRISKEQLDLLEVQSQGNANVVVENVIQNVILSYYLAKLTEEQLAVVKEVLQLSADRVAYQNIRQEYGQASTFDILQTQDAFLSDSSNYLIQVESYQNAIRNLNRAMGVNELQTAYTLTDPLDSPPSVLDLEELRQRLISGNTNLRNALINQQLSSLNTDLAQSNRAPRVSLSTGATYSLSVNKINAVNPFTMQEFGTATGKSFNAYANITASYTIYSGGARQRAIENALVQEQISYLNTQDLQQTLLLQLESAYGTYQNQLRLVELNKSLVENARQNLAISEERFKGGLINSFDYRTIQLSYINSNQALLNAVFNLKNTETTLMQLTGDLLRYN